MRDQGYRHYTKRFPHSGKFKELMKRLGTLVHPTPEPGHFQGVMKRILHEFPTGRYPDLANALIGFFYDQARTERPEWLSRNTLIRFRGIDVLPADGETSPAEQQA
jgi:hypothetical protein